MRDRDAEGQGIASGWRLARILPVSHQPDIKALYCRRWREEKKADPGWVEETREAHRDNQKKHSKTAERKRKRREWNARYRAKKKREREEMRARGHDEAVAEYREKIRKKRRWRRTTSDQVRGIEERLRVGHSQASVAREFDVQRATVRKIMQAMFERGMLGGEEERGGRAAE